MCLSVKSFLSFLKKIIHKYVMNFFYKLPLDNLKEIQTSALNKIPPEEIFRKPTRLFYPNYNFLDDENFVLAL